MNNFFKTYWKYVIVVLSIVLVAGLGSLFVNLGLDWFGKLEKPTNFIPSFVIPVVWSIIYTSYAIVLCIWLKNENIPISTIVFLILNGVFNILWCLFFFTLNNTLLGLIVIVINLILAILLTIDIYKKIPLFSYILSLYPVWLCLATCLNLSTWILN
ncbi:MAG: tryptophan-rich sensory protein [Clostridia bacterium]|nr:tryptophan-rich sensory protein [Clostridia bacterium]